MTKANHKTSPLKSATEELDYFRKSFLETLEVFSARVEADVVRVRRCLEHPSAKRGAASRKQLADVRDMLTLLRRLEVKPKKGRRRDLKRFEGVAEDLRHLIESWE